MPEVVEMLGHMDDALRTLRRMFEALLDVSKLDAGVMKTEPRVTALKPLLFCVSELFPLEADKRACACRWCRSMPTSILTPPFWR
ncbi:MAG: hypothetical protein R3D01_00215 [Hyphomicrobiales bacterium]